MFGSDATTLAEHYTNAGDTGTGGVEAQLKTRYAWMTGTLAYSFYTAAHQNDVESYTVPGHGDLLLAAPAHKLTLSLGAMLWRDHVHSGVTVVYLGPRYELLAPATDGSKRVSAEPDTVLVSANVSYRNLGVRGLELTAGVQNALGQLYRVAQPYDGGHAPYPLASREVYLRLSYAQR